MSAEETRQLARNYLEVLNRTLSTGNFDVLDGIATLNLIEHGPSGTGVGVDSWKANIARSRSAMPDSQLFVNRIIADGAMAVIQGTLRGTHLGEGMGFPATGKTITLDFVDILRFQGGKLAERWLIADTMQLMQQLGMAPEPGA